MRWLPLLLTLAACAPAHLPVRERLPGPEADAYEACIPFLHRRVCADGDPDPFAIGEIGCMKGLADRYVALPAAEDRRTYLVELGCPTPVVRQHLP